MVAGGISRYGKTELIVVDKGKTVNGEYYRDRILPFYTATAKDSTRNNLLVILMQDGAPGPHSKCYHDEDPVWLSKVGSDWPDCGVTVE